MIRAAAKNHAYVTVIVNPKDYAQVMDEMKASGGATSNKFQKQLAATAFARTGSYDAALVAGLLNR